MTSEHAATWAQDREIKSTVPLPAQRPVQRPAPSFKKAFQLVPVHSKAVELVGALSEDCDFPIHWEVPTDRIPAPERPFH